MRGFDASWAFPVESMDNGYSFFGLWAPDKEDSVHDEKEPRRETRGLNIPSYLPL